MAPALSLQLSMEPALLSVAYSAAHPLLWKFIHGASHFLGAPWEGLRICSVLYCAVLYCVLLYCVVLYCTVQQSNLDCPRLSEAEAQVMTPDGGSLNQELPTEVHARDERWNNKRYATPGACITHPTPLLPLAKASSLVP